MSTNAIQIKTDPDFYAPFQNLPRIPSRRSNLPIYLSGQAAIDNDGNVIGIGNFDAQAEKTFENIQRVLEAGGSDPSKIIKITIYSKDMTSFPKS